MNNPRSNLVWCVVYSQSETGRQTVLHMEGPCYNFENCPVISETVI